MDDETIFHGGPRFNVAYEEEYSKYQVHLLGEEPEYIAGINVDLNHKKVVDLGCGGGINSYYIKEKYPDSYLIPIDISFIRCSSCSNNTKVKPVQADIVKIPLKSESVDFVACTMVIEHVQEDALLVEEILRVLKKGGTALVSSVVKCRYAWYFRKNKAGVRVLDNTHLREYGSVEEFKRLFGELRIEEIVSRKISFSPLRFIYRFLYKLNIITRVDSRVFLDNIFLNKLLKFKINIPRFRAVEILCEKV